MPSGPNSPITHLKIAVAALLDLPLDDLRVLAIAVAYKDCVYTMQKVVEAGYGNVNIYFEEGWLKSKAHSITELPDYEHRKRNYKDPEDAP